MEERKRERKREKKKKREKGITKGKNNKAIEIFKSERKPKIGLTRLVIDLSLSNKVVLTLRQSN